MWPRRRRYRVINEVFDNAVQLGEGVGDEDVGIGNLLFRTRFSGDFVLDRFGGSPVEQLLGGVMANLKRNGAVEGQ